MLLGEEGIQCMHALVIMVLDVCAGSHHPVRELASPPATFAHPRQRENILQRGRSVPPMQSHLANAS